MSVEKWRSPIFEKKIFGPEMGQLGLKRGQNEVLGLFYGQSALVFANFAYYDWELWYLVGNGGQSAENFFVGPKMGPIRAKKGLK